MTGASGGSIPNIRCIFYGAKLLELWPTYRSYGLSALVVGTYWVNHHFVGAI